MVYESDIMSTSHSVVRWASVELLHNVRRYLKAVDHSATPLPKVRYRAKVKLDGTNAAIQILPGGEVAAQSRSRMLKVGDDNFGFAAWVDTVKGLFAGLHDRIGPSVVFGEWCGPGVQKRTAIARIDRKIFAVFAIQLLSDGEAAARLIVEPEQLRALLPTHNDLFVLPWHGQKHTLDYGDDTQLSEAAAKVNAMVDAVERVDPWVRDTFGVEGLGEGLVLYPMLESPLELAADGSVDREQYTALMFKAKGEKHQVVKQKRPAQIAPEVAAHIDQFVDMFVTEPRLQQALTEGCGGVQEMSKMGPFLKWLSQDIQKESVAELEASNLSWKQVSRAVASRGRQWFKQLVERI